MARLIWTNESKRWFRDVHDYIALDNPDAAASVVGGIYERAQSLQGCREDTGELSKPLEYRSGES